MKPSEALDIHRAAIRRIVAAHHADNPRVFGPACHGEDSEEDDLEILVDPAADMSLLDIGAITHELEELTGLTVEVLTPKMLPDSLAAQVLGEAQPI